MFAGRKKELAELERRFQSEDFELGVLYGNRRIGKTFLISEFAKGKNAFCFQARQGTEEENLRAFSREFNEFRGLPRGARFDSFEDALDAVAEYAKGGRFFFSIDELAYLCDRSRAFLSTLQYYIDGKFRDTGMLMLLSGSNVSFMENILKNKNDPLYKRARFRIHLQQLPFGESMEMLEGLDSEEKIEYLALFGGYPYYLGMIDKAVSFEENVRRLLFREFGTLLDAPDKVLPSSATSQSMYNSILRAIAMRRRRSKDIADYIGEDANYTAKYLTSLVEMKILERRESFSQSRKMNYYEISDPLLRFWYCFIYGHHEEISIGMGDAVYSELQGDISDFIARGFEDVVLAFMTEQNILGRLPHRYGIIRNFVADNSILGRSVELDGLAEGLGDDKGQLLVIECKYRKNRFSAAMLDHLRESASIFPKYSEREYYIFSKSGYAEDLMANHGKNVHLLTIEDLMPA